MNNNNNVELMTELEVAKAAMKIGFVQFTYTKVNGEKRIAVGTTNHALISAFLDNEPSGNKARKQRTDNNVHYFDVSRMNFRQFRPENFGNLVFDYSCSLADVAMAAYAILYTFTDYNFTDCIDLNTAFTRLIGRPLVNTIAGDVQENLTMDTNDVYQVVSYCKSHASKHLDSNASWCMQHNGGRGLNGVSLAAGGVVSSGYDCFGNPIRSKAVHSTTTTDTSTTTKDFAEETKQTTIADSAKPMVVEKTSSTETNAKINVSTIDWEQRRFELVKALLANSNLIYQDDATQDQTIKSAIKAACKVIAEL